MKQNEQSYSFFKNIIMQNQVVTDTT